MLRGQVVRTPIKERGVVPHRAGITIDDFPGHDLKLQGAQPASVKGIKTGLFAGLL